MCINGSVIDNSTCIVLSKWYLTKVDEVFSDRGIYIHHPNYCTSM